MTRQIDTDAVINSIRLKEQASAPAAVDAGYWALHAMEGGLYHEDDNEVTAGPLGTGLVPGGRLTLTTATPVTTADVTAAATLYYTPYIHNMIELYDGARWIPVPFTEKSLSLVGYTASKPYDIWGYLSSGTLALESTVWTDGTTRATALAYQDGRLIKNGTTTRRYLGTIYINSSGGQTDDSITKRNVWNYYNRIPRRVLKSDATNHTYNSTAGRAWNNDATQKMEFVCGVLENYSLFSITLASAAGNVASPAEVYLYWDGATASGPYITMSTTTLTNVGSTASYAYSVGYHYVTLYEHLQASTTAANFYNYGMMGLLLG